MLASCGQKHLLTREWIYIYARIKIQAEKKLIHGDAFRLQPRHHHSRALAGPRTLRALSVLAWCLIEPRCRTYGGENSRLHHAASAQFPWVSRWNHHPFDFNCLSLHDPLPRYQSDKTEWCNFMCKPPPPPCRNNKVKAGWSSAFKAWPCSLVILHSARQDYSSS